MTPTLTPMRVLMADHQRLSRRSMANLLKYNKRIRVVGEAAAAREALAKIAEVHPDLVLLESGLPDLSLEVLSEMARRTKVVVLAEKESSDHLLECLRAGARGYVGKDIEPEALFHYILCVIYGGVVATPGVVSKAVSHSASDRNRPPAATPRGGRSPSLTSREIQILQMVAQGATNREMAKALAISESTVKTHLRNIMDKLRLSNKAQAAAWAIQIGLINLEKEMERYEASHLPPRETAFVAQGA